MVKTTLLAGCLIWAGITASNTPETDGRTAVILSGTPPKRDSTIVYHSDHLTILRLSPHVYQHISYLNTSDYGKVSCNGMIVSEVGEAIVFDTPASLTASSELIVFVTGQLGCRIKAVIPTHFHEDCVAGMQTFMDHAIPVYASNKTLALLETKAVEPSRPIIGFDRELSLPLGGQKVHAGYYGEGHTADNIIGYYSREKAMFGGCLIKAVGAGKGNLSDANIPEWPKTVKKISQKFPRAEIVIPGHGNSGGLALLAYTIQLFQ